MKKLLFILFTLCTINANAQFKLTIDGFKSIKDDSKNFIVIQQSKKDANVLYNETLKFIHSYYKNPDIVSNEIKGEMITISGFKKDAVGTGKVLGAYLATWDMEYNISFQFKDGRVRIDAPSFDCRGESDGKETLLVLHGKNSIITPTRSLFKADGKVNMKDSVRMIEDFFNGFVNAYTEHLNTEQDEW